MTSLSTQPYKGTRDFYPEDMAIRNWMFGNIRATLKRFGYQEYDGPMLEPFELYASKTSEEIVNEQLYWLMDRGERKLAIRPEMTPTLARMVAAKLTVLPKPIRWFSIPNLWRYERPQRGRLREHWQLNVDLFGGQNQFEDLEVCQIIVAIMNGLGAKSGFEVRLNHRGLTNALFGEVLNLKPEQFATVGRLLDAAPKMGAEAFQQALEKEGLTSDQTQILLRLLQKDGASYLSEKLKDKPAMNEMNSLLTRLQKLEIGHFFKYDPAIMRGFMYYTGMVLEVYDLHPENNRALFGGGRYDNLVGSFGGESLSGVGFGMGDVTLRNFLETHQLLPNLNEPNGLYIAFFDEAQSLDAGMVAQRFRSLAPHLTVLTGLSAEKAKKAFNNAEKLKSKWIMFIGENEVQSQKYSIKELATGTTSSGSINELVSILK